jgi:hypothetical protein
MLEGQAREWNANSGKPQPGSHGYGASVSCPSIATPEHGHRASQFLARFYGQPRKPENGDETICVQRERSAAPRMKKQADVRESKPCVEWMTIRSIA